MEATQNNVSNAHNWMIYMDRTAASLDLTMQVILLHFFTEDKIFPKNEHHFLSITLISLYFWHVF